MTKMKDLTLEEAQLLWDLGTREDIRFKYMHINGNTIGPCSDCRRPNEFTSIIPEWTKVYMLKVEDEEDNA